MKRNVDYVTIDDYTADMRDLSGLSVHAIAELKRENAELKRALWLVAMAAGGLVYVPPQQLMGFNPRQSMIEFSRRLDTRGLEIEARILPANAVREPLRNEKLDSPSEAGLDSAGRSGPVPRG